MSGSVHGTFTEAGVSPVIDGNIADVIITGDWSGEIFVEIQDVDGNWAFLGAISQIGLEARMFQTALVRKWRLRAETIERGEAHYELTAANGIKFRQT